MRERFSPVLIVAAACLWGTMGLFVRRLNAMGLASMEIVECRCIMTVLILFPITALRDRKLLIIQKNNIWPLLGTGIASMVLFNYCYFSTIARMNLSAAAILLYTAPIFVMLLSLPLFGEKLTGRKLIALGLAFFGCCLVSGVGGAVSSLSVSGILLGLGSGLGYALYSIFSRFSLNQGVDSTTITDYTFLFAALGGAAVTDFGAIWQAVTAYGWRLIGFMAVYCLVTTVLPYLLYTAGLRHVENGPASVMASVEPVVATVLGLAVFHETPSIAALLGMALVLCALALLSIKTPPERQAQAKKSS